MKTTPPSVLTSASSSNLSEGMEVDTPSTLSPDPISSPLDFIAKRASELINVINDLSHLGIENRDIQLPKIVAVGDQSSGKSSLIESISGIHMPRDSGTCTRVPFHINTTRSAESWSCNVFLDSKYTYHKNGKFTTRNPLGPWTLKDDTLKEAFAHLSSPEELEMILRRAQMALLNPCRDPKYFRTCPEEEMGVFMEIGFSPNIVRIEIESPDVRELSLYDLPGIFAQTGDGQSDLPLFVSNLVASYVKEKNNIILLVMPMDNDPENCHAGKLVREYGALDRAIGVITKPDRFELGRKLDSWQAIFTGKIYVLGHGYYVTRQPSPEELQQQISRTEATDNEFRFFNTNKPWTTEFASFQSNFGASKIQEKLGELLVENINGFIPQVSAQIKQKLHEVNEGLAQLPPPPGNKAMSIVENTLSKIEHDLTNSFSGHGNLQLFHQCRQLVERLEITLGSISPGLTLPPVVEELSSDEGEVVTPTPKRKLPVSKSSPAKKVRPNTTHIKRDESTGTGPLPVRGPPNVNYTLEMLQALRTSVDISGIRSTTNQQAMKSPINVVLHHWEQPITHFVDDISNLIKDTLLATLDRSVTAWSTTPMAQKLRELAVGATVAIKTDIMKDARRTLHSEQSTHIMIFDDANFQAIKDEEMAALVLRRPTIKPSKTSKAKTSDVFEDPFRPELELYSSIKAYLDVCNKSLTYHVAKHVFSIISDVAKETMPHLRTGLGIADAVDSEGDLMEKCKSLLVEDDQRGRLRTQLELEKRKWDGARRRLGEVMHAELL